MRVGNLGMTQPNQQYPLLDLRPSLPLASVYVADQSLLVVCLSSPPQITSLTTELVDESLPTKKRP